MKAIVIREVGGPDVLKVEDKPIPQPSAGQVLIRVKAFGLNRSELFTRQGHSANEVQFPRVLGIEATGVVAEAPGNEFPKGSVVATAMGGMGRKFDGGYAEYTCVPADQVVLIESSEPEDMNWAMLGAIPEMFQTAYGALTKSLKLQASDRLLIRGGTSSVGLAAAAIARNHFHVQNIGGTSRKGDQKTADLLKNSGVTETLVDDGKIAPQLKEKYDKVLELVGVTSLLDSLRCVKPGGIVCMAGMVGNSWLFDDAFSPMAAIPTSVCLTTYSGAVEEVKATPLKEIWEQAKGKKLEVPIGKIFHGLESIVEAHACMDESSARGKIVIVV